MKILLTGATGYLGRRLLARLAADPRLEIRVLARNRRRLAGLPARIEVHEGDTLDPASLEDAFSGVEVAYYLIHSMGRPGDFEANDRLSAANFLDAACRAGVRRLVYLGGLGLTGTASKHLRSRLETGEILGSRPDRIQTIWFRAGVIIGSGSTSFEIVRHLVQKLPLMVTPKWVKTRTQPIAVADVLHYLDAAKDLPQRENLVIDIGGERLTFGEMLLQTGRAMGLRRFILPVPVLTPRLSSYWLVLFTPVPYALAGALVEGLKSETVVTNALARQLFPEIQPVGFADAGRQAIAEIEQHQVVSRWSDSGGSLSEGVPGDVAAALFVDRKIFPCGDLPPERVFWSIVRLGGEQGWFTFDLLWEIRGLVDKLMGGYGLNRGRRDPAQLRVGDSLDFWKVLDLRPGQRLLLQAEMKLPGRAWLEFLLQDGQLVQTAYFYPHGLRGRLYWYLLYPAHLLIFRDLGRGILRRARAWGQPAEASPVSLGDRNTPSA